MPADTAPSQEEEEEQFTAGVNATFERVNSAPERTNPDENESKPLSPWQRAQTKRSAGKSGTVRRVRQPRTLRDLAREQLAVPLHNIAGVVSVKLRQV